MARPIRGRKRSLRIRLAYFEATFECRFDDDRDDLDELKVAVFSVDNDLVFLLSLYKHQPDQNGTTLLMERRYSDAEVVKILSAIQEAFELVSSDIVMLG